MSFDVTAVKEPLYTERETASLLRISPSYLRLLRGQKKISCLHFGGRVLYREEHIKDFKQRHEQRARMTEAA
jgi:hypothetical protein